jgi:histidinol-phosphate aminotransferase
MPEPSFEMIDRYAVLAGGEPVRVPWTEDRFPTEGFLERIDGHTAVIAIVSPNNPTGGVATLEDVERIAAAAPDALVLLDHAYVEYADEDLTRRALSRPNVIVLRTFSKARGLAGCRVGYALGGADTIAALRAAGGPYPVAGPSLSVAVAQWRRGDAALATHVSTVRRERADLLARLTARGIPCPWSQANFVLPSLGSEAGAVQAALLDDGFRVRRFDNRPGLTGSLRITLPGDPDLYRRFVAALDRALDRRAS